jgi:hypothetical protein
MRFSLVSLQMQFTSFARIKGTDQNGPEALVSMEKGIKKGILLRICLRNRGVHAKKVNNASIDGACVSVVAWWITMQSVKVIYQGSNYFLRRVR